MLQTKQIHDKENEATTKGGILQQFVSGLVSDDVIHAVFAQHVKGKVGKEKPFASKPISRHTALSYISNCVYTSNEITTSRVNPH